jgi:hypothetical protein
MRRFVRGACLVPVLASVAMLLATSPLWPGGPKSGGLTKEQEKQIVDTLKEVANKGAELFNKQQDYAGCYRLYEGAVVTVRPLLASRPELQKAIDTSLDQAAAEPSAVEKAFIIRKAIDQIRATLSGGKVQPPDGKDKDIKISGGGLIKLKQGEAKDIKITVTRGKDLKGKISVQLKPGEGLAIKPEKTDLDPTTTGFVATVTVSKTANPGKTAINITGTAEGKTVKATIPVEIEKAAVQPPDDKEKDFKISGGAVKLKAGEKKDVTLKITRGKEFKEKIAVELTADKGLKVEPQKKELGPADNELKIAVSAAKEAEGKAFVHVIASGGGKTHKGKIKVEVDKGPPPEDKEKTLKLSLAPGANVKIAQGGKLEITVTIERGKTLKEKVGVELKASKGLMVVPQKKDLAENENTFKATLTANKDAPPGKGKLDVTASGGGKVAEASIELTVDKAGGPGPDKKGTVSGKVTIDGKPLTAGNVNFFADNGAFSVAIGPGGEYTISEKDLLGRTCKVSVTGVPAKPGQPKIAIPNKYQSPFTSGLMVKVKEGSHTFNIDLKSAGQPDKKPPTPPNTKVSVSGNVQLNGKPVAGVIVHFVGSDGKDHTSPPTGPNGFYSIAEKGIINNDGTYKVTEPFPAGSYQVSVTPAKGAKLHTPLPQKYQDAKTSGLTDTIKPGLQEFNIKIQSENKVGEPAPKDGKKGNVLDFRFQGEFVPAIFVLRRAG